MLYSIEQLIAIYNCEEVDDVRIPESQRPQYQFSLREGVSVPLSWPSDIHLAPGTRKTTLEEMYQMLSAVLPQYPKV